MSSVSTLLVPQHFSFHSFPDSDELIYFLLHRLMVSTLQPGVYLWTVPMTGMTGGEGSLWLIKWGRNKKQNSLHLGKLFLCGSLFFSSLNLMRRTKRTLLTKASIRICIKAVIKLWMSQRRRLLLLQSVTSNLSTLSRVTSGARNLKSIQIKPLKSTTVLPICYKSSRKTLMQTKGRKAIK